MTFGKSTRAVRLNPLIPIQVGKLGAIRLAEESGTHVLWARQWGSCIKFLFNTSMFLHNTCMGYTAKTKSYQEGRGG